MAAQTQREARGLAARSAPPGVLVDAQEIASHQLFEPALAPAALGKISGETLVAVDAVIILEQRIDADRLARRRNPRRDALELPLLELFLGLRVERRREHAIVGANPDMVFAGDIGDMLDVRDQIRS